MARHPSPKPIRAHPQQLPLLLLLVGSLILAGCGAGFAAVFGDEGSSGVAPPPPTLVSRSGTVGPLLPPPNHLAEVELQNSSLPATISRISVQLMAFGGAVVEEQTIFRLPRENSVEFFFQTALIRAELTRRFGSAAIQERDVPAQLRLLVDGVEVAARLGLTLLRQPTAFPEGGGSRVVVSPLGTSDVTTRIASISLQLPDPAVASPGTQRFTDEVVQRNRLRTRVVFGVDFGGESAAQVVKVDIDPASGDALVTSRMPSRSEPVQAHYVVDSDTSGRSSLVSNIFYRPHIFGSSPANGASEGGTPVVLSGQALVPTIPGGTTLDFSRIRVIVRKGGRESVLPDHQLRTELSNRNRLVFPMPPSPDGRSGPADIRLEAVVDAVRHASPLEAVQFEARSVFVYGDALPYFGPRGVQLREPPVLVKVEPFLQPGVSLGDALVLTEGAEGMPFLGLYGARGNGLFTRFGVPVRAGRSFDPLQRGPVDLCVSEFFNQGVVGGVILNRGVQGVARHSFIISDATTNPPLRFNDQQDLAVLDAGLRCSLGDFNKDGIDDMLILPDPSGQGVPQLYISELGGQTFGFGPFSTYPGPFAFTAVQVVDVDADGNLDLLFAEGGAAPRLLTAFGDGFGGFDRALVDDLRLNFTGLGYTPSESSRAVGVHLLVAGRERYAVVILSGIASSAATPPAIIALPFQTAERRFRQPLVRDVQLYAGASFELTTSVQGALGGTEAEELVVAAEGGGAPPLRLLSLQGGTGPRFTELAIPTPVEEIEAVRSLAIRPIAAKGSFGLQDELYGLVVAHETRIGSGREYRISTFLADPAGPGLLRSPSAARQVPLDIQGMATGVFHDPAGVTGPVADTWLALPQSLQRWVNDGLGDLSAAGPAVAVPGLVSSSLETVKLRLGANQAAQDTVVFLTEIGALGLMAPDHSGSILWLRDTSGGIHDLRRFGNPELQSRRLLSTSAIRCADVDRDGIEDLVILCSLGELLGAASEGEALLLFLKGLPVPANGGFPFAVPRVPLGTASSTHGNASDLVLADFAPTTGFNPLELALTVPRGSAGFPADGNHVRFYRLEPSGQGLSGRFIFSSSNAAVRALVAGREPAEIEVGDYNNDGRQDLAVVARVDRSLSVFYNFTTPSAEPEVDISRFQASPANPVSLGPGTPLQALSRDINGDGVPDLVLSSYEIGSPDQTHVGYLLSPGQLGGVGLRAVPPERSGAILTRGQGRGQRGQPGCLGLADFNNDGIPDLLLGWNRAGAGDYNLRLLFGNNF